MKGTTLIELMIVVAIMGIIAVVFATSAADVHRNASYTQNRERAWQVLEYEADAITRAVPGKPATREALLARVPEGQYRATPSGSTTTLEVSWTVGDRTETETLIVVGSPR